MNEAKNELRNKVLNVFKTSFINIVNVYSVLNNHIVIIKLFIYFQNK